MLLILPHTVTIVLFSGVSAFPVGCVGLMRFPFIQHIEQHRTAPHCVRSIIRVLRYNMFTIRYQWRSRMGFWNGNVLHVIFCRPYPPQKKSIHPDSAEKWEARGSDAARYWGGGCSLFRNILSLSHLTLSGFAIAIAVNISCPFPTWVCLTCYDDY